MCSWRSLELGLVMCLLVACQAETPPTPTEADEARYIQAEIDGTLIHLVLQD